MLKAIQATRPFGWFTRGANIRTLVNNETLQPLAESISNHGILQPLGAIDHGDHGELIYGFQRLAAVELGLNQNLPMPDDIPVMLYAPGLTEEQIRFVQLIENLQRKDLTDVERYEAFAALLALDISKKDIAARLSVSASSVTRTLSPDNCPAEAKEHFLAGRLTIGQCYAISTSDDPPATMIAFLNGETHVRAARATTPKTTESKDKAPRVKIPMVSSDKFTGSGIVTVAGTQGGKIDFEQSEHLLKNALRQLKEAQDKGWSLKKAMTAWRAAATS